MKTAILAISAAAALALAGCSSSSSKVTTATTAAGGAATTAASPATTAAAASSGGGGYQYGGASATTAAASGGAQIGLSSGHLVAPDGHTVYFLAKETGTTSLCTGGCASVWPGVASTGAPVAASGVDASKLSTANGQVPNQVVYNGHLLYEFAGDKAAGDTNGTKIPGWHDVNAAGTAAS
jgi:predicted lipoprotein with Yx(FWY)xxD motif